jgi:hypothetical protein
MRSFPANGAKRSWKEHRKVILRYGLVQRVGRGRYVVVEASRARSCAQSSLRGAPSGCLM